MQQRLKDLEICQFGNINFSEISSIRTPRTIKAAGKQIRRPPGGSHSNIKSKQPSQKTKQIEVPIAQYTQKQVVFVPKYGEVTDDY